MPMDDKWISVSEAARLLGMSTTHVYSLIHDNKVEYRRFVRGKYKGYLVYIDDIKKLKK